MNFVQIHCNLNECMNNLFDLFGVFRLRLNGFNNNMKRCARSVIIPPIFTITKSTDFYGASHHNLAFSTGKLANRYSFPTHFSRSNGIWWVKQFSINIIFVFSTKNVCRQAEMAPSVHSVIHFVIRRVHYNCFKEFDIFFIFFRFKFGSLG